MKELSIIATLTLATLIVVGCKSTPSSSSGDSEASCTEPQNPYDEGSGHYAGYQWAAEHSGTCETGSTSFDEGCDEYDSEEDAYEKCVAQRR
ncbi:MAG: hypothetical protein ABSC65_29605 [Acidobacteriaceae bacterium]|jgi:hypothetical protein